ncbi:NUDIX hydrolase domain-like protein [Crassisporium funariophilum]|nr:NUDIX hydrolase domain-like protein [Crassisporium funariophilum]
MIYTDPDPVPPGISKEKPLEHYASGGNENPWLSYTKTKYYTNAFIVQNGRLLLGMKKRGFGKGKYNGFGGKVDPGETSLQAAKRELEEEAGITAPLEHAGSLLFMTEGAEWAFQIEIYRAESYEGAVTETDEMKPEWFSLPPPPAPNEPAEAFRQDEDEDSDAAPIPFEKMWDQDYIWLPLLISERKFVARADFTKDGEVFKPYRWWFGVSPGHVGS